MLTVPRSHDDKVFFETAESSQMVEEDVVLYSQSLSRLQSYQAGVDFAAEKSFERGLKEGRAEGIERGIDQERRVLVRNMASYGISSKDIAAISRITVEEVEKFLSQK